MGLISKTLGISGAVSEVGTAIAGVAEVFVPNASKKMVLSHEAFIAAMAQFGVEFQTPREGIFDRFVNGLNRLPRPALAIGTLGLFVYAMASPDDFSVRMQGLAYVPEPLWWLLGAVVSFYFGAREMYHVRHNRQTVSIKPEGEQPVAKPAQNAALQDWQGGNNHR